VFLAVAALLWMTVVVLESERRELRSEAELLHQESMRLALWRMDSWLAPRLAQEAARPYFEYRPFYTQTRAYTRVLSQIEPGEVLTPSPLLDFRSDLFRLHFELDEAGKLTSPQVPEGNFRDLAESGIVDANSIVSCGALLEEIEPVLRDQAVAEQIASGVARFKDISVPGDPPVELAQSEGKSLEAIQQRKSQMEGSRRAQSAADVQQALSLSNKQTIQTDGDQESGAAEPVVIGPLVPVWLPQEGDGPRLAFMREGEAAGRSFLQGVLAEWSELRRSLLERIEDIFPAAELVPVSMEAVSAREDPDVLATLPVRLVPNREPAAPRARITLVRATLVIAWLSLGTVVLAAGLGLRSAIAVGEKRRRFASAVTHELRTPLTTFRMYSDMLAEGMVPDVEQPAYFMILRDESARLAALVENVLSYARLEERRGDGSVTAIEVGDLLGRIEPQLRQRAEAAGMGLEIEVGETARTTVRTDPDRVGQILFNLVDNACKYGGGAGEEAIEITARGASGAVELRVRDHGPGIDPPSRRRVFAPFERAGRGPGDTTAGVGLGLALARGLARDLGGDLVIEEPEGGGASFVLTLPRG
jgi:signal transduction histidine kinase